MLATIDIGNTNITIGIFDNDLLKGAKKLPTITGTPYDYQTGLAEIFRTYKITDCIIASVVNELTDVIKNICQNIIRKEPLVLSTKLKLGIILDVETPDSIGADRIANTVYANRLYDTPVIVVDAGTAITFDIISKAGIFYGGIIMPGLELQAKSLSLNTSKLPQIKLQETDSAIGKSTQSSILSGIIRGSACAIDGLLEQCGEEIGEPVTIIGTGGNIKFLAKYMSHKFNYINPDLTLYGLKYIYSLNQV